MPHFPLKRRRTTKPNQPVGIDWSNPLSRGLEYYTLFNTGDSNLYEHVDGRNYTSTDNVPSVVHGKSGKGVDFTAGNLILDTGKDILLTGSYSVTFIIESDGVSTNSVFVSNATDDLEYIQALDGTRLRLRSSAGSINFTSITDFSTAKIFTITCDGTDVKAYEEGVLVQTITSTPTDITLQQFGRYHSGIPAFDFLGEEYLFAHHSRLLSDAEVRALHNNPYQVLEPETQYIYTTIPVGGAATGKSNPLMGPLGGPLYGVIS